MNDLELDGLLEEALGEATQRKIARQRRPAPGATEEETAAWYAAVAAQTWQRVAVCAVYVEEHCECGSSSRRFLGWYRYDQHLRESGCYRWELIEQPDGTLDTYSHTIRREALWCQHCTHTYPAAVDFGLPVEALGMPAECNCGHQLEFEI